MAAMLYAPLSGAVDIRRKAFALTRCASSEHSRGIGRAPHLDSHVLSLSVAASMKAVRILPGYHPPFPYPRHGGARQDRGRANTRVLVIAQAVETQDPASLQANDLLTPNALKSPRERDME